MGPGGGVHSRHDRGAFARVRESPSVQRGVLPAGDDESSEEGPRRGIDPNPGIARHIEVRVPARGEQDTPPLVVDRETYHTENHTLTPSFLRWLRSQAKPIRRPTKPRGMFAAVHVRRGDVDPCSYYKNRYLPSSYFVDVVKRYVPENVPVTVYSEAAGFEPFHEFEAIRDANGTNERSVSLRLDADASDAWEAIMAASHIVLSRSSFSYVPALLNEHATVVYPSTWRVATPENRIKSDNDIQKRSERRVKELIEERCPGYVSVRPRQSIYNATRQDK